MAGGLVAKANDVISVTRLDTWSMLSHLSLSLSLSVYLSLCICVCVCYNERQSEEMYFSFIEVLQHDASAAGIGILLYPAAIAS